MILFINFLKFKFSFYLDYVNYYLLSGLVIYVLIYGLDMFRYVNLRSNYLFNVFKFIVFCVDFCIF